MAKIESEKPRLGISACLLGERVRYGALLMKALAVRATPARHASALRHAAGSLEPALGADERAELGEVIDAYRRGARPLGVPLMLIGHHVRRGGVARLADQVYLDPHPEERRLRHRA
jgi:uncharacterized protein YbgA (DUF1722 family)